MTAHWRAKYTQEQRDALEHAFCDAGLRNMSAIGRLARAGELRFEGKAIPAFEIPDATVREICRRAERNRMGASHSKLADMAPGDAVEQLRRRLCNVLDHEMLRLERRQSNHRREPLDAEQVRKLGRATRELAALPGLGERSLAPGQALPALGKPTGEATISSSPDSLARKIRDAMRAESAPPRRDHVTTDQPALSENSSGGAATAADVSDVEQRLDDDGERKPGSWTRDAVGRISQPSVPAAA